ncbi:MAG: ABC transporter ATP-binding protein [Blastocatellia bacterium]|nr:ABC transporter ATP-binding protein [Blastocatellia bacterium]
MADSLLKTNKATIRFGGLVAVNEMNLDVQRGQLFGLIGPNGAGKTTIFNLLTGVYQPTSGDISVDGVDIRGKLPCEISALGVSRTFQNIRLFADMTVLENVKTACHLRSKQSILDAVFRTKKHQQDEQEQETFALELLEIFKLDHLKHEKSTSLPYGSQRRLEIARALATRPKLLLLDEPAAGMNPQESVDLMKLIGWIRDRFELTILLVEHNMKVVMGICERIQVVEYGQTIAVGTPHEIKTDKRVIEAYLGSA